MDLKEETSLRNYLSNEFHRDKKKQNIFRRICAKRSTC